MNNTYALETDHEKSKECFADLENLEKKIKEQQHTVNKKEHDKEPKEKIEEAKKLLTYRKDIRTLAIYGGDSIVRQIQELRKGVHFVVGTPGRILDHLNRKTLAIDALKMIILDEADEMLSRGFKD